MTKVQFDIVIACYGLMQKALRSEGLVNEEGAPIKQKRYTELKQDTLNLYKWQAEVLSGISEYDINRRKQEFNQIVRKLNQEYKLSMFLMSVFILEDLVEDMDAITKGRMLPKITRVINSFSFQVILHNEDGKGKDIVRDSAIAADNIFRMFNGQPEITKAQRDWKAKQWRKNVS